MTQAARIWWRADLQRSGDLKTVIRSAFHGHNSMVVRIGFLRLRGAMTYKEYKKLRQWVLREHISRYGNKCLACKIIKRARELEVDHVYPRWSYPDRIYDVSNLQILCKPCNSLKSGSVKDYRPDDYPTKSVLSP